MSTDLTLVRGSGPTLTRKNLEGAALEISRRSRLQLRVGDSAVHMRLRLLPDDEACAAIAIGFARSGGSLKGTVRGAGALLYWCFYSLAEVLGATVRDPQSEPDASPPDLAALEREAIRIVEAHEGAVEEKRGYDREEGDPETADSGFSDLLVELLRRGAIAFAPGTDVAATCAELVRLDVLQADPGALYEALLEADEIDEVFVGEADFTDLIGRLHRPA